MRRLCLVALFALACHKGQAGPQGGGGVPVTVAKVQQKNVPLNVRAIGNVEPISSVTVRPQIGGVLQKVNFKEGQEVKKGDLLFEIDPRPLQAQLLQAQAMLARDEANAKDAEATARRYAALVKKEYVTQQQADNAQAQAQALKAALAADRAAVQQARLNLAYAQIRSPVSGRTGSLLVHAGNVVKATDDKLVVIDQVQPIYVSFSVPEQMLAQIRARAGASRLAVTAAPALQDNGSAPEQKAGGAISGERHSGVLTFVDNAVDADHRHHPAQGHLRQRGRSALARPVRRRAAHARPSSRARWWCPRKRCRRGQNGEYVYVVKQDGTVESRAVTVSARRPARRRHREGPGAPARRWSPTASCACSRAPRSRSKAEAGS